MVCATAASISGQSAERKNNPYAPSPAGNSRPSVRAGSVTEIASIGQPSTREDGNLQPIKFEEPSSLPIVVGTKSTALSEVYRVGIDDVIYIKIQNASSSSSYYTVQPNGTIDFPLAGSDVAVAGLTPDEISRKLAGSIKLFANPKVEVTVREYASHAVTVSGNVKNPGRKHLRREAVPLFVIRAEAMIDASNNSVRIVGEGKEPTVLDLHDPRTDNVLVYPGDTVNFSVENAGAGASYFISGSRITSGERPLSHGLTLLQAVIASNNPAGESKKATIRRKNKEGKLSSVDYDLRAIKAGKVADPTIETGDVIEIRN